MTTQAQPGSPESDSASPAPGPRGGLSGITRIFDDLADACLVVEPSGRMRYANEAARTLLRMQGRATGRKLAAVLAERRALDVFEDAVSAMRPRIAMLPLTFSSDGPRVFTFSAVPFTVAGEGDFIRVALSGASAPASNPGTGEAAAALQKLGDPLSIIQGYLENLLDGVIKEPAVMRQCLGAMQRQAAQMQRVLSTLRM